MKKLFIFFCIFTIILIAFFDARDRLHELDEVAANTPSQVEMKQQINERNEQNQNSTEASNMQKEAEKLHQKINQSSDSLKENQLNNFEKRRNTIDKQFN